MYVLDAEQMRVRALRRLDNCWTVVRCVETSPRYSVRGEKWELAQGVYQFRMFRRLFPFDDSSRSILSLAESL
jgi:hypothetical protein